MALLAVAMSLWGMVRVCVYTYIALAKNMWSSAHRRRFSGRKTSQARRAEELRGLLVKKKGPNAERLAFLHVVVTYGKACSLSHGQRVFKTTLGSGALCGYLIQPSSRQDVLERSVVAMSQ